jgi:hypothetical protein
LQTYNEQTLDAILSYYNIPATAVKRVFLPLAEIGAAVLRKPLIACGWVYTISTAKPLIFNN